MTIDATYLEKFRDTEAALRIADKIKSISQKPLNIMEVCGGHTMAIRKNGIQKIVGEKINLISGPGCPVCVTSIMDIDKIMELADQEKTVICTFGDMFYVPGTNKSLQQAKAEGSDIRIVYSALDALSYAEAEPDKNFIFIGIGFETTVPTVALAIIKAHKEKINNFYVLGLNKTMPEALKAVLDSEDSKIDALICPGHVTAITGMDMYKFIPRDYKVSCCVSGFEPLDLLRSIYLLTEAFEEGKADLVNAYERVVKDEGNVKAKEAIKEVFEASHADWRGVGTIKNSGLSIKEKYAEFDAEKKFDIRVQEKENNTDCICGDILRGAKKPVQCNLFGKECTPENPQGACMVSSEGTCSAWYKYGE